MTQPSFSMRGAVDLGALRSAPARPTGQPAPPGAGPAAPDGGAAGAPSYVVDVGEADLQFLVDQSMTVPVVIDFWADWCGPCKQLSPVLERLAAADGGAWLLAKIDLDANQRLGAAFGVQSIPAVFGLVGRQPVPLFLGALPEAQVREHLDVLLRYAADNGVTGRVGDAAPGGGPGESANGALGAEPPLPAGIEEALDAIDRRDFDAAAAAYRSVLAESPGDPMAKAGLAGVELLRRAKTLDPVAARRAADARPDDVAAQSAAADADILDGRVEAAFNRLIDVVRRTSGADRDRARAHLLELFEVVGPDDPDVTRARSGLASALF